MVETGFELFQQDRSVAISDGVLVAFPCSVAGHHLATEAAFSERQFDIEQQRITWQRKGEHGLNGLVFGVAIGLGQGDFDQQILEGGLDLHSL